MCKDIVHRLIGKIITLSEDIYNYDKDLGFLFSDRINDVMQSAKILMEGGFITSEHFKDLHEHIMFIKARYE